MGLWCYDEWRCVIDGSSLRVYCNRLPGDATLSVVVAAMFGKVGGQAVLGRQNILPTPWLTERHGYDPTSMVQ